jgi:hypothetical protein
MTYKVGKDQGPAEMARPRCLHPVHPIDMDGKSVIACR